MSFAKLRSLQNPFELHQQPRVVLGAHKAVGPNEDVRNRPSACRDNVKFERPQPNGGAPTASRFDLRRCMTCGTFSRFALTMSIALPASDAKTGAMPIPTMAMLTIVAAQVPDTTFVGIFIPVVRYLALGTSAGFSSPTRWRQIG